MDMTSPAARRLPPPSSVWEADSHPSKITLLHSLSFCKPLPLVLPKHSPTPQKGSGGALALGALWLCDALPLLTAGFTVRSAQTATPPHRPPPPNTSCSSSLAITAAGVSSAPHSFPRHGERLRRADEARGGRSGALGSPGLSYLGTCTASWLELCPPD